MTTRRLTHVVVCDCDCHDCCIPRDAWCDECEDDHDPDTGLPVESTS